MYPPRNKGGRWRAVWYEDGERQQCESVSEEKIAAKLEKVRRRLAVGASNMTRPGAELIAWYLNPDRLLPTTYLPLSRGGAGVVRSGWRRGRVDDLDHFLPSARLRRRERDALRRAGEDVEFQRRFAAQIARLYPGCPAQRAQAIASHAGVRGSGRVGRSAAGRALDEQAVTLAVQASIRHEDTSYDDLLMSGVSREEARAQTRPVIDRILTAWSEEG